MTSIDLPLKDKIILITGGASGIGLALAKQSYDLGAKIIVGDLKTTADFDTFAANRPDILFVQSDVSKWSDLNKLFDACQNKWGDVPDAYGICAGLFEPAFSNFWLDTEEDGYKQVEVNVNHPVKLTRLAIKKSLSKGKRASVCIIASIAGIAGNIAVPLYCATKHAIVGFVKSLKDTEALTGVKVTSILPGLVNTPLFTKDKIEQFSVAKQKALEPDQVAAAMLDLLQKKELPCGTCQQIDISGLMIVPEWNISAPTAEGTGRELNAETMFNAMIRPIKEKLESERGGAAVKL